ncbi:MAG TPA: hypothetical protein VN799_00010 [Acidimicrobiales bacterium]|nr:hypothetical protein [Acidimicrobiales bacterium]
MTRALTLYVASPVTAYGTPHRGRALAGIRAEVGAGTVILDPAVLFTTDAEWLAEWPRLVRSLDMLVIVPAADRTVGAGVLREVSDALAHCVPVSLWAPPGRLVPWAAFDVRGIPSGTAGMAAWVVPVDVPTDPTPMREHAR